MQQQNCFVHGPIIKTNVLLSAFKLLCMTLKPAIVLVSPKGADNVGAIARAMKNFGFTDLRIVAPRCDLNQAARMAVHAQDVLENAKVFDDLLGAIGELKFVVATTARPRRDHAMPVLLRDAAKIILAKQQAHKNICAVVFGREEHGLFNEELDLCQMHIRIPSSENYAALNLAQAVGIVAYELEMAALEEAGLESPQFDSVLRRTPAVRKQLEPMYAHLAAYLQEVGFSDAKRTEQMMRRFRQIFDKSDLTLYEVNLLRGLLSQGMWASQKARGAGVPGSVPWPLETVPLETEIPEEPEFENTQLKDTHAS